MGKDSKVNENSKRNKLIIIVLICIIAMIGLMLGIAFSAKVSLFNDNLAEYTLNGNYKLTDEDIRAIGMGGDKLQVSHACCIDLNGYTLDLNGYDFSVLSNAPGTITFKNGKVKNGKLTLDAEAGDLVVDNVKFEDNCDYKLVTKTSSMRLSNTNVKAESLNVEGEYLSLVNSTVYGNLVLTSHLSANNATFSNISVQFEGAVLSFENSNMDSIEVAKSAHIQGTANCPVTVKNEAALTMDSQSKANEILMTTDKCCLSIMQNAEVQTVQISAGKEVKVYGNVATMNVNAPVAVSINKLIGDEEISGANVGTLNLNASSASVNLQNCANVDNFNVNGNSEVTLSGTVKNLEVASESQVTIKNCSIVKTVNITAGTDFECNGTVTEFNVQKPSKIVVGSSAYIKEMDVVESAGETAVSFNGQGSLIKMISNTANLNVQRDADITFIMTGDAVAVTNQKMEDQSNYAKVNKILPLTDLTDEQAADIENALNTFIMPIIYVNSDCKGAGFITYSEGGKVGEGAKTRTYSLSEVGHEYKYEVIKKATDKETGIGRYTCMDCGDSYDIELPIRTLVFDAPTLFDFFGINLETGEYDFALKENSIYYIDNTFGIEEEMAVSVNEPTAEPEVKDCDILFVKKAFIHVTVEKTTDAPYEVRVYGNAELDVKYYENADFAYDITKDFADALEAAELEPTFSIDLKALMTGSEIFFSIDGNNAVMRVYDMIEGALAEQGIIISVEDITNIINAGRKINNLAEKYEAAANLLFNTISNGTSIEKLLPAVEIFVKGDSNNGKTTYSLDLSGIIDVLDEFGSESLAQYIDDVVGKGTVSMILDYLDDILDQKVRDIYENTVILASNYGIDEDMLLEDLNTLLSVVVNDIVPVLSDEEQEIVLDVIHEYFGAEPTIEYLVDTYYNDTLYEARYGKAADGCSEEEYAEYVAEKNAKIEKWQGILDLGEAMLYGITVYDLYDSIIGKLAMGMPVSLSAIVDALSEIDGNFVLDITVDDTTGDATYFVLQAYDEEELVINVKYDVANDKFDDIMLNVETDNFICQYVDNEEAHLFEIAIFPVIGIMFSADKKAEPALSKAEEDVTYELDTITIFDIINNLTKGYENVSFKASVMEYGITFEQQQVSQQEEMDGVYDKWYINTILGSIDLEYTANIYLLMDGTYEDEIDFVGAADEDGEYQVITLKEGYIKDEEDEKAGVQFEISSALYDDEGNPLNPANIKTATFRIYDSYGLEFELRKPDGKLLKSITIDAIPEDGFIDVKYTKDEDDMYEVLLSKVKCFFAEYDVEADRTSVDMKVQFLIDEEAGTVSGAYYEGLSYSKYAKATTFDENETYSMINEANPYIECTSYNFYPWRQYYVYEEGNYVPVSITEFEEGIIYYGDNFQIVNDPVAEDIEKYYVYDPTEWKRVGMDLTIGESFDIYLIQSNGAKDSFLTVDTTVDEDGEKTIDVLLGYTVVRFVGQYIKSFAPEIIAELTDDFDGWFENPVDVRINVFEDEDGSISVSITSIECMKAIYISASDSSYYITFNQLDAKEGCFAKEGDDEYDSYEYGDAYFYYADASDIISFFFDYIYKVTFVHAEDLVHSLLIEANDRNIVDIEIDDVNETCNISVLPYFEFVVENNEDIEGAKDISIQVLGTSYETTVYSNGNTLYVTYDEVEYSITVEDNEGSLDITIAAVDGENTNEISISAREDSLYVTAKIDGKVYTCAITSDEDSINVTAMAIEVKGIENEQGVVDSFETTILACINTGIQFSNDSEKTAKFGAEKEGYEFLTELDPELFPAAEDPEVIPVI